MISFFFLKNYLNKWTRTLLKLSSPLAFHAASYIKLATGCRSVKFIWKFNCLIGLYDYTTSTSTHPPINSPAPSLLNSSTLWRCLVIIFPFKKVSVSHKNRMIYDPVSRFEIDIFINDQNNLHTWEGRSKLETISHTP